MMPPWAFKAARAEAAMHLQLFAVNDREERKMGKIRALVIRRFRNAGKVVGLGQLLSFRVPVIGASNRVPTPGGPIELRGGDIAASRWLEGFFEMDQEKPAVVRSQIAPIRRPTWRPVYPADFEGFVFPGNL